MAKENKLTPRQQLRAILGVAGLSLRIAPGAVSFKLIGAVLNAVLPIATTYFAARSTTALAAAYGGSEAAKHQVIVYIVITALLGLVMTIWSSLDNYMQGKLRYVVEARIADRMYSHFLSLDFWRYDDKNTIDLYDKALNFGRFYAYVFDRIASIVTDLIAVISAVIALSTASVGIAVFVFLALIPGIYVQFRLSRAQIAHWNENVESRRTLNMLETILQRPTFISELRLYGMVQHVLKRRTELKDESELQRIEIERKTVPLKLLADSIQAVAEVISLLWVATSIARHKMPVGQFIYVQQLVARAINSTSNLAVTLSNIDEDVANLFDYQQFMQLPTGKKDGITLQAMPEVLSLEHVSFHYPGKKSRKVLDDINLTIEQGKRVAIVGENGAGKSTLIKLITGLYQPSDGQIMLDDTNLHDIDVASWHRYLGVLQQDFLAYDFATAADNVHFGNVDIPHTKQRLEQALHDAEAYDFVHKLPKGVDSYVNTWMEDNEGIAGVDLSGGQWQRLALARNFYREAPLIILDEPTSAIDALAEARIFDRLFGGKKRTVITISHRLSTIKKADIIYMLKDGKIVETGTHDELIAKKGEFYHVFKSQIEG